MPRLVDAQPLLEERRVIAGGAADVRPIPANAGAYRVQLVDTVAGLPLATFQFGPVRVAAPAQVGPLFDRAALGEVLTIPTNAPGANDSDALDNTLGANQVVAWLAWYPSVDLQLLMARGAPGYLLSIAISFGPLAPAAQQDFDIGGAGGLPLSCTHVAVGVDEVAGMAWRQEYHDGLGLQWGQDFSNAVVPLAQQSAYMVAQPVTYRLRIANSGGVAVSGTVYALVEYPPC